MIAYFPAPYPDELLYSQLARYYAGSGYTAYAFAAEDLYQSKNVRPDIEFLNAFTSDALQAITRDRTMEEVVLKGTMFPYYGRFLPKERRQKAFQALVSMKGNYYGLLQIPRKKGIADKNLRYCPLCVSKDRQDYGETYWHRTHQMIGLDVCPAHKCYLHNSNISIKSKASPLLKTAEDVIPLLKDVTWSNNEIECYVADYMAEIFRADIDMETDIVVSQLFQLCIGRSSYCSLSGQQGKMGLLYNDFMEFCKSMANNRLTELHQFYKVFNNSRIYFDEICLLAIFLNISAPELVHMKIAEGTQQQIFEGKGTSENWNDVDSATLPLVRAAIKQLHGDGFTRPRNVTVHTVERLLNLPSRRISLYLPQCYAVIKQNRETKARHWARVIVWAVHQIQATNSPISWQKVYELTNLRPTNFKACLPYIDSYADEALAEQLRGLV